MGGPGRGCSAASDAGSKAAELLDGGRSSGGNGGTSTWRRELGGGSGGALLSRPSPAAPGTAGLSSSDASVEAEASTAA